MADVTPNWQVEIQRLKAQIAQQHATIEKQKLDNMELIDRQARNELNIEAAQRAIKDYQAQLKDLEATHGKEK